MAKGPRVVPRVDQHTSSLKVWIFFKLARGFTWGAFELKQHTDEKADKNPHQVAISMFRTAEAGTTKSSKKLTLVPVKRAKANRK